MNTRCGCNYGTLSAEFKCPACGTMKVWNVDLGAKPLEKKEPSRECLTKRYKFALNALLAIQRHMEIVMGPSGTQMSTVEYIVKKALDSINYVGEES